MRESETTHYFVITADKQNFGEENCIVSSILDETYILKHRIATPT